MNSMFKVGGHPVFWKTWYDKDIITVEDLWDGEGFKSHTRLGVNWLDWVTVTRSIPDTWLFWLNDNVFL